ncbi:PH domain-containing protein [Stagonosporopsis vannaccii]|nr:PH domain-containing protein [Stagonosporopsis vannaccii]
MLRAVRSVTVLSFMSQWGGSTHPSKNPTSSPGPASPTAAQSPSKQPPPSQSFAESATALNDFHSGRASPSPAQQPRQRSDTGRSSRPMSMIQTYQPPIMEVGQDTLPELQRIFMFLNSHSNKLYQEGYFLKFHDTDTRGRPAPDRKWQEYFVQLVGTIMSLWDASELDQVGGEREVIPTFINLTDAAIHMIPAMTLKDGKKLDHILSVSTAAKNKYLLHFDSYHALTQWTAAIRLAMYEHTTLQEAYTGSLIAGKGKFLNNIRMILARENAKYEDWVRVRFGAGTPWRRCWCVINPPDQKEYAKLQKDQKSKKNPYEKQTILKGDMKFYETKKITKKTKPIATVKDAFACYAIYPQSKPLIDSSTLVKIEGKITVHSQPETTTEGFVFVMPESRPAITGFEIMLQFLFPVFDTFNLYGRPKKLIADVLDTRGLMFAMPNDRRYGYLELWDVTGLINKEGSQTWSERQWRKQMKDLTSTRMNSLPDSDYSPAPAGRRNTVSRAGFTPSTRNLRFQDGGSVRSQPSTRQHSPVREVGSDLQGPRRVDSAPPIGPFAAPRHQRSVSENVHNLQKKHSRLAQQHSLDDNDRPPTPPQHGVVYNGTPQNGSNQHLESSDTDESPGHEPANLPELPVAASAPPVGPVDQPPSFAHASNQKPPVRPAVPGSTIKPNPHVDNATLHQMADATSAPLPTGIAAAGAAAAWKSQESLHSRRSGEYGAERGQQMHLNGPQRPVTRDDRSQNRMPTIPASPYVEHAEFVQPPQGYEAVAPPVPEHGVPLQSQARQELPHRPHSGSSGGQIHRKPVPGRSPSFSQRSTTSSSLGSLRQDVIDPEALDALNQTETSLFRQQSKSSSRYDDDAISTSTPDYASTHSEEIAVRKLPARREDRPRSGVLRTIGDPSLVPSADTTAGASHPTLDPNFQHAANMPSIDFGPTYALGFSDKRPGTSGSMTPGYETMGHEFSRSKENLAPSPNDIPNRNSYISSGRTTPNAALHMRSTSASPNDFETRQVAWQPAMASPRRSSAQKLDAEEWVLHRAAQQSPGLMNYARQTPPPMNRTRSGDWAHLQRTPEGPPSPAARPSSRLTLSRPPSRGAELLLDAKPTTLSAREQEQVARMTGTPLLDMSTSSNKKHQQEPSHGLTGYIDFREKEKAAAKQQNRQSAAMQAEIDKRMMQQSQRQMQEQQRQMEARQRQMMEMQNMNQQMAMAQSMYAQSNYAPSMMGTPQGLGTPTGMPGMAYSTPSQAQMYSQQGYFPQQPMTPQMQVPGGWVQTPAQSMQGQYFQQPQQQYMQSGSNQNYPPTRPYQQRQQQQQRRH